MDEERTDPVEVRPRVARRGELTAVVVLLFLCAATHLLGLGRRPLWDIDEGMHAATSRLIVESGDWVLPRFNGEPFLDKPILFNWLVALSFQLLGFTELAARLPAALLGTSTVLLTFAAGRRAFGLAGGFLAGAVLATSFLHVVLARVVVHDVALCFFVTGALVAFSAAYRSRRPRPGQAFAFWACVGFAFLAKGPVGPVLVALPIGFLLFRDRRWRFLRELRPAGGALLALAIAAPWYVAVMLRAPEYGAHFFLEKNVLGFLEGTGGHPEPSPYYVPVLLVGLLPWTGFGLVAAERLFRQPAGPRREELVLVAAWFLATLLFFSAASSKLATYVLPCMPPAALATGWIWSEALRGSDSSLRRSFRLASAPLCLLLALAAAILWIAPPEELHGELGLDLEELAWVATGGLALAALVWAAAWRGRYRLAFATHVAYSCAAVASFALLVAPRMDDYRSTRAIALALDRALPPAQPLAMWRGVRDSAVFYSGRDQVELVHLPGEIAAWVASPRQVFFMLDEHDLERIRGERPDLFVVAERGSTLVLSNQARPLDLEDGAAPTSRRLGDGRGATAHDRPCALVQDRPGELP